MCCLTAIRNITAKTWRSVGRVQQTVHPGKNVCRQRDFFSLDQSNNVAFPLTSKNMLPLMTINQTDNPNFNWQFLQLETFLNDYSASLFLDRRVKLVVLISIITAIWQIWKSLHLIRIITTHHLGINRGDQKTTSPKQTPNYNSATIIVH